MTNAELIQKIRNEIERLKKEELTRNSIGVITGSAFFVSANELLSFLDTLEEDRPELYNPVYDEAYLNEKIAKATKSWKGVDVDSFLAECRGYEEKSEIQTIPVDLEKEIDRYWRNMELRADIPPIPDEYIDEETFDRIARHFAQWGAEHRGSSEIPNDLEEAAEKFANQDCVTFISRKKGFIAGAKWQKLKDEERK